jgi:hypothetical protein
MEEAKAHIIVYRGHVLRLDGWGPPGGGCGRRTGAVVRLDAGLFKPSKGEWPIARTRAFDPRCGLSRGAAMETGRVTVHRCLAPTTSTVRCTAGNARKRSLGLPFGDDHVGMYLVFCRGSPICDKQTTAAGPLAGARNDLSTTSATVDSVSHWSQDWVQSGLVQGSGRLYM